MTEAMTHALPFPSVGPVSEEERDIVERLRAGDVGAMAVVYDAYAAHVHAFAIRFLGDQAAADDLVQETFVALDGAIRAFAADSSLRTFLLSIAIRRARRHLRAAARRRAATARFSEQPQATAPTPEEHLENTLLVMHLARALDTLPIDQRVAFVLFDVEERTSAEVAAIVGVSEATARARAWNARRKVREYLEKAGVR